MAKTDVPLWGQVYSRTNGMRYKHVPSGVSLGRPVRERDRIWSSQTDRTKRTFVLRPSDKLTLVTNTDLSITVTNRKPIDIEWVFPDHIEYSIIGTGTPTVSSGLHTISASFVPAISLRLPDPDESPWMPADDVDVSIVPFEPIPEIDALILVAQLEEEINLARTNNDPVAELIALTQVVALLEGPELQAVEDLGNYHLGELDGLANDLRGRLMEGGQGQHPSLNLPFSSASAFDMSMVTQLEEEINVARVNSDPIAELMARAQVVNLLQHGEVQGVESLNDHHRAEFDHLANDIRGKLADGGIDVP